MSTKRFVKTVGLISLLATIPWGAWAAGDSFGSARYLSQGIGGRATGLGGAFVALADDITAGYWNPAGLGQLSQYRHLAGFQYAYLGQDISASYLAYALTIPGAGTASVSWLNSSVTNMVGRNAQEELTHTFGSYENTLIFSYGTQCYDLGQGFYLGGNLKILQQGLDEAQALGHGLDLGAIWQPISYLEHTLGLQIQNLFQRMYWDAGSKSVEPSLLNVKCGVALKFFPFADRNNLNHFITTADLDFSESARFQYHAGAELWYSANLGFRLGVNPKEFTLGASFRPENYEVAYAYHYDLSELASHQHTLSLALRFQ